MRWDLRFYQPKIYLGCGPLPVTVGNEGLYGFPTKHVIILVVTVTGRGPHPMYIFDFPFEKDDRDESENKIYKTSRCGGAFFLPKHLELDSCFHLEISDLQCFVLRPPPCIWWNLQSNPDNGIVIDSMLKINATKKVGKKHDIHEIMNLYIYIYNALCVFSINNFKIQPFFTTIRRIINHLSNMSITI